MANREQEPRPNPESSHNSEESSTGFTFESTATSLRIPRENWNDPTVRQCVEFINRTQQLGVELSIASSQRLNRYSGQGEPLGNFLTGKPEKLAQLRELFGAPDMKLTMANRYDAAELLMRGTLWILQEGLGQPPPDFSRYLVGKLNAALNRFGLEVVKRPKPEKPGHS